MPANKAVAQDDVAQEIHISHFFKALAHFLFYKKETHWTQGEQVFTLVEDSVEGPDGEPKRAMSGKIKQTGRKQVTEYTKKPFRIFKALVSIWLAVGFSLFMLEEAGQVVMFSTFPLQDTGQYEMIGSRADAMRMIADTGRVINYAIGWTMPPMMVAYLATWDAQDMYADSLDVLCAVNASVKPAIDVLNAKNNPAPSTAWAPDGTVAATPTTAQPDFGRLTGVVVGPPDFNAPPVVPGAIVIDEAADMAEVAKWVGWGKTIIFPCTSVSAGASVTRAKSPFGFEAIAFTKSGGPACEALKSVGSLWVAVQGEIVFYQEGGTYEIILNTPEGIQGTWPLVPEAGQ